MFAIVICLVLLMCTMTIWRYVLCVLMVEGMSVVSNKCNEPTSYEVVVVPYVDVVVAVTVMCVLLFVCLLRLRECDGARLTAMLV